jgi:hypothetical protein
MQGVPLFFNLLWILALVVTTPISPKDLKLVGNFGLHPNKTSLFLIDVTFGRNVIVTTHSS